MSTAAVQPPVPASRLEAAGLCKRYGARTVVKDVRLVVNAGEVIGLLGPNGAGKTTTFYMIVRLVRSYLAQAGFSVETAADGDSARSRLQRQGTVRRQVLIDSRPF